MSIKRCSLVLACALMAGFSVGCSSDDSPAPVSFTNFSGNFVSKNLELKTQSLSDIEMSRVLGCEDPSTVTRLRKSIYSVSFDSASFGQQSYDAPVITHNAREGYSTSSSDSVFEKSFMTLGSSINNNWVVASESFAYTDTCSNTNGCDPEKRVFTKGSAWTMVKSKGDFDKTYNQALKNTSDVSCSYTLDADLPSDETVAQVGTYGFAGADYPAVLVTTKRNMVVNCMDMEVTKAVSTTREVIIADVLPQTAQFSVSRAGERSLSCARTRVFMGHSTESKETLFQGGKTELTNYAIKGTVLSKEAWNQQETEYAKTLAKLEQAVSIAQSRVNESQARYSSARAAASEALTKATSARSEAEKAARDADIIANDPDSTDAEIAQARAKADNAASYASEQQLVYDQARSSLNYAEAALNQANQSLQIAKEELRRFKDGQ